MLASPSRDQTIRLWDAETGECLRTLRGQQHSVTSVAFDPAGRTLASGSMDSTVLQRSAFWPMMPVFERLTNFLAIAT